MDERRWPMIIVDDEDNTWRLLDPDSSVGNTKQYKKESSMETLDLDFDAARGLERKVKGTVLRDNRGNIIQFMTDDSPDAMSRITNTKRRLEMMQDMNPMESTYEIIPGEIVKDGDGRWADLLINDMSTMMDDSRAYNSEMGYASKSGDYAFSPSRARFVGVKGGTRYNPRYGTPEYWVNAMLDSNAKKAQKRKRKLRKNIDFLTWRNTQPEGPQIAAMHGGRPYSRTWVKDGRNKVLKKPIQVPGTDLKITALGMDRNGNSTVRLAPNDKRKGIAFSIQTNQNLPTLHRNKSDVLEGPGFITMKMADEIRNYVLRYGTEKQLSKGGLRRTALGGFRVMDRR